MKNFKRILSLMLILVLLLPSMVFANTSKEELAQESLTVEELAELENLKGILFHTEKIEKVEEYEPEDEVRIIVELQDEPIISYAIEEGLRYNELSVERIEDIETELIEKQSLVKEDIRENHILMTFDKQFTVAFNGFSGRTKFQNIEAIEDLPEVKEVYISQEYERPNIKPDMASSSDIVRALDAWEMGYKGEGMVVAVIDSGIDPSHKDFVLSEDTEMALTKEIIEDTQGLKGRFFTDKVPYGYNYYDRNTEIRDLGPSASEHGMHVAGTVVANGDPENEGIKGIAPEAQVLAMKVFSNDPIYATTFDDIYLEAIDEAIRLGANVLNMSLGSTASFYIKESPVNKAITKAVENGIVCSISAGNSGAMTWGYTPYNGLPFKENPDIGLVGAPGLSYDSIQVASFENTHVMAPYLSYKSGGDIVKVPMTNAGNLIPAEVFNGEMEFIVCGLGKVEDFIGKDLKKKIALIIRGEIGFVDKIMNAQNAGAAGVIVYNHSDGGEALVNMQYPPEGKIPALFIGYKGGLGLSNLEMKKISFPAGMIKIANPNSGYMSDFTSWGTTPSLELKPELTAPGGQIYSTLQNNKYGIMSGTSMAAPHVAGGSALVSQFIQENDIYRSIPLNDLVSKEYEENELVVLPVSSVVVNDLAYSIKLLEQKDSISLKVQKEVVTARKENKDVFVKLHTGRISDLEGSILTDVNKIAPVVTYYDNKNEVKTARTILRESTKEEQAKLVKVMLMNTANIVIDEDAKEEDTPISPRRQGAGQMDLQAAITTPVLLINKDNGEAKVELKDFESTNFTMNLRAINIGNNDVTYKTSIDVLTDYIVRFNAITNVSLLSARKMTADVSIPESITIPAGQTVDFTVTVDFSEDYGVYRNMFVEGFVKLVDETDTHPDLNIPYMGFHGDWTESEILDGMRGVDEKSYYGIAGMLDGEGHYSGEKIALSPGTIWGRLYATDTITPVISLMRNAEEIRYNILDKDMNHLRTLKSEKFLRKNYYYNGRGRTYYYSDIRSWDGYVQGKRVDDGLYYYQIKSKVHYNENDVWQEKLIPVYVDTKEPIITDFNFNPETGLLSWKASDGEGTGILAFVINVNDKKVEHNILPEEGKENYEINIGDLVKEEGDHKITLLVPDYAMNVGIAETEHIVDINIPYIYLTSPELFDVYHNRIGNKVKIEGAVFKNNKITSIDLIHEGETIELPFNYESVTIADPADPNAILASGPAYKFSKEIEFEDGLQEIKIVAKSESENVAEIVRWFYVDTTNPEFVKVEVKDRRLDSPTAEIEITMKDNFPVLTLYHGDSEVYSFDGMETNFDVKSAEQTTSITIPLEIGENEINLRVFDIGDNAAMEVLQIVREGIAEKVENNELEELEELEELKIGFADGESEDGVTEDVILPEISIQGLEITWESSHPEILNNNGTLVNRPEVDTAVTLTVTIIKDGVSKTKTFEIIVLAEEIQVEEYTDIEDSIEEPEVPGDSEALEESEESEAPEESEDPIEDLPVIDQVLRYRLYM